MFSIFLRHLLGVILAFMIRPAALVAETPEPYDKNFGGPRLGVNMTFGQSVAVGKSDPGLAWLFAVDGSFVMAQDTWTRMEFGLEVGTGQSVFKMTSDKSSVELPHTYAMAKGGYGYSIGNHAFSVIRIGAGPVFGRYEGTLQGNKVASNSVTGLASMLGVDLVYPAGETGELVGGFRVGYMTFSGDGIDSFQVRTPSLSLGFRILL